jgi:hypothetical protein
VALGLLEDHLGRRAAQDESAVAVSRAAAVAEAVAAALGEAGDHHLAG